MRVLILEYNYNYTKGCINICDNLCFQRFSKNHVKSQTHTKIIRKTINDFKSVFTIKEGLLL